MEGTSIDDQVIVDKATEKNQTKLKSALKGSTNETEISIKPKEKKRKAPIIPSVVAIDALDDQHVYESRDVENENNASGVSNQDQEVPIKPKKKRTPKIETTNENDESVTTEESIKKKKSKVPKIHKADDNTDEIIDNASLSTVEPSTEVKRKEKKSKKSKIQPPTLSDSFENLQVTNLDDVYPIQTDTNEPMPIFDGENLSSTLPESIYSEYTQNILSSYNDLAVNVDFSQYVKDDQWTITHLPKSARTESKSRIKKMLPGSHNHKDEKPTKKASVPKGNLFTRIRAGVTNLVSDESNLIFGEQSKYESCLYDDEEDGVDTDDLNRYAQKLRELEDQDREINPEFLVIRDGKTVYGVHEADTDGKIKLASRKPIYDRFADQAANEKTEKKKFLSRLKNPFSRNKDKEDKSVNSPSNIDDN